MKLERTTADELIMSGTDDHGRKYCVHIDRLVAANLCKDLEQWLGGRWGEAPDVHAWLVANRLAHENGNVTQAELNSELLAGLIDVWPDATT